MANPLFTNSSRGCHFWKLYWAYNRSGSHHRANTAGGGQAGFTHWITAAPLARSVPFRR